MENYSDRYLRNGYSKPAVTNFIRNVFRRANLEQYKIVLTRFEQNGDLAFVDGFVSRKGFRAPVVIQYIIKESDGKWRWYGNQR